MQMLLIFNALPDFQKPTSFPRVLILAFDFVSNKQMRNVFELLQSNSSD